MKTGESYVMLKDAVIYNIHHAPTYPEEDATNLDEQRQEIMRCLSRLRASLHSPYKLNQLDFATREVDAAFEVFVAGREGRHHLEEAVTYIDKSKAERPPKTDFIVGKDGGISHS